MGREKLWSYGGVVLGNLCSKSNSRQIVRWGNKVGVRKSDAALQYVSDFLKQIPRAKVSYTGPVVLRAVVYYRDMRPDLDIALFQDLLQQKSGVGLIKNDRQIEKIHLYRRLDKKNPRVKFLLRAITSQCR